MQRELTSRPALGPENGGSGEHDKADYIKNNSWPLNLIHYLIFLPLIKGQPMGTDLI